MGLLSGFERPSRGARALFENCICASRQECVGGEESPRWILVFSIFEGTPCCEKSIRKDVDFGYGMVSPVDTGPMVSRWKRDDQATKGTRWMPRRQEAKKDVGSCEKPRGAANQALIRGCPNGETHGG